MQQIDALLVGARATSVFVTAEGVVEREGKGYSLTLSIATGSGSRARTVTARDCAELATVAASLVAIAVDPGLVRGHASPPVAEGEGTAGAEEIVAAERDGAAPVEPAPVEPAPASPPGSRSEAAPAPSIPAARAVRTSLLAGVGLSVGVLPGVTPTVHLGAAVGWRALYAQASVRHRTPRRAGDDDRGATLWTLGADARACGAPGWSQLRFPLCVGVEVGTIAGRSFGVSMPDRGRAAWVAMSAGGGLLASLGRRLGLAVGVDLVVPVVRAGFEIEGIGELHRVGPIGMDAAIALHVKIP